MYCFIYLFYWSTLSCILSEGSIMDQAVLAQLTQLYMTMKLECPFYQVCICAYCTFKPICKVKMPLVFSFFLHDYVQGPQFLPKLRVKSFLSPGSSLESVVDTHLYNGVKNGLVDLLGDRTYFASRVLTPYCYTLGNVSRKHKHK